MTYPFLVRCPRKAEPKRVLKLQSFTCPVGPWCYIPIMSPICKYVTPKQNYDSSSLALRGQGLELLRYWAHTLVECPWASAAMALAPARPCSSASSSPCTIFNLCTACLEEEINGASVRHLGHEHWGGDVRQYCCVLAYMMLLELLCTLDRDARCPPGCICQKIAAMMDSPFYIYTDAPTTTGGGPS